MQTVYQGLGMFRKVVYLLTALMLVVIGYTSTTYANAPTDNYKSKGSVVNVDPSKVWTVTFNSEVDRATITDQTVYVMQGDKKVSGISTRLGTDKKTILISSPSRGYLYGETYTLYLEDGLKSTDGINLSEKTKYVFTIKTLDYTQYTLNEYFSKVEWIKRDGVVSLSMYPQHYIVNTPIGHDSEKHKERSFQLLRDKYSTDSEWKNTESLKAQYLCHVNFAGTDKVPWNIEPHRTTTNSWQVFLAKCNPK